MRKFLNAFSFMTIIPVPGYKHADLGEAGRSAAYFPVVGLVLGLILAAAGRLCLFIWPVPAATVIVTVLWIVLTAGLHIDGLADLADGLGGGWDAESRLKIMRDSAIGTYGALAIIILLMMKAVLIYTVAIDPGKLSDGGPGIPLLVSSLIIIPAAARSVQVLCIRVFASAKKEGFGAVFKNAVRSRDAAAAVLISLAAVTAFWGWTGATFLTAAVLFMLACGKWISVRIGGLNGDSYGAVCELSELFLLVVVSIIKPQFSGWLQFVLEKLF